MSNYLAIYLTEKSSQNILGHYANWHGVNEAGWCTNVCVIKKSPISLWCEYFCILFFSLTSCINVYCTAEYTPAVPTTLSVCSC